MVSTQSNSPRPQVRPSPRVVNIMQVTDSLLAGGLERVAVTLANTLPAERFRSHLCVTRLGGPLADIVSPKVPMLLLNRRGRFNISAARQLSDYIRDHDVRILHAHGTSLFFSVMAAFTMPRLRIIWHDHFGRYATEERPVLLFRIAMRFVSGVIAVNQPLAQWAKERLRMPADRVWYVPNYVCEPYTNGNHPIVPGTAGSRIVCVANLRQEKGHLLLLEAMQRVVQRVPHAHLVLVGRSDDLEHLGRIQNAISERQLDKNVSWLGARLDVPSILKQCDIGVLGSLSEGLPLALIEYGFSGLATVVTNVGQCAEVLDSGRAGRLVPPGNVSALANALVDLLESAKDRSHFGTTLREWVRANYSAERVIPKVCEVYDKVLGCGPRS